MVSPIEKRWYLGPLGYIRELTVPDTGMDTTITRYGGIHQGLSGARQMDVTGHKAEYDLQWTYLERDEWQWLDAMHQRLVPGPFRLINPLRKNRLSTGAAVLRAKTGVQAPVRYSDGGARYDWSWPSEISVPGRSMVLYDVGSETTVELDPDIRVPVLEEETVTFSFYRRGESSITIEFNVTWYDREGSVGSSSSGVSSFSSSWGRSTHTVTAPAGAVGAVPTITVPSGAPDLYLAAPLFETGDTATEWDLGGGAPEVLMDSLSTSSPRFPLTDCSAVLVET